MQKIPGHKKLTFPQLHLWQMSQRDQVLKHEILTQSQIYDFLKMPVFLERS